MTGAVKAALDRTRALSLRTQDTVIAMKAAGISLEPATGSEGWASYRSQSRNRQMYSNYRSWVYAAVHALASEGAGQPVSLYRSKAKSAPKKSKLKTRKFMQGLSIKAKDDDEAIMDHPILDRLHKPNPMQLHYQFVYSFIASIYLTGWGFIVCDDAGKKDGDSGLPYLYSLPTTWITPKHEKGPFSEFIVADPSNPKAAADAEPIPRSMVHFAYFPDPSNPLAALSPAASQTPAIQIDNNIQNTQVQFFENGLFPSAIVTVGKDPHPDVPAGVRPRLTAAQRRQVHGAIRKVSSGVANYGNPVILDGLIESVERLSATQNELGWEKSEKTTRNRILSAFGVHPFILGEEMVGSYAQAAIVEARFGKRLNVPLGMLSGMMTDCFEESEDTEDGLEVLYEPYEATDMQMRQGQYEKGRASGDVTKNEYRAFIGLPPDDSAEDVVLDKTMTTPAIQIAAQVTGGGLTPEQGLALLIGMGVPKKQAEEMVGDGPPEPEPGAEMEDMEGLEEPTDLPPEEQQAEDNTEQAESETDSFDAELDALLGEL